MRCIAVPEAMLASLVEKADALHSTLLLLGLKQPPAVAASMMELRGSLREVSQIYHDAVDDGEEANHVVLHRASTQRRSDRGHREPDAPAS